MHFPDNRLRPPGPGVGTERGAQRWLSTQGNLGEALRVGKDVVLVTGKPVDARPQQAFPLREEERFQNKTV